MGGIGGIGMNANNDPIRKWRDIPLNETTPQPCSCGDEVLDIRGAAEVLLLSESCIYAMVSQGRLKRCVKRGKPMRFKKKLLIEEFFGQA